MIYYRSPADCPNRDKLARMTLDLAADWAVKSMSHCTEISRRAEIMTFYCLTADQERLAFEAALDRLEVTVAYRTELTPEGEQLVIPGCERNYSPKAKQLDLF